MANVLVDKGVDFSGSCCVYTALIGDYERLNEQPVAARCGLRFICLTDDPGLRSETWECRVVEPLFPEDPVRSQRDLKIRPHVYLPEFTGSLYIDNSVLLKEPPERLLELANPDTGFLLPVHSFRETVLDEFLEVSRLRFDDDVRIFEQLNHYLLTCPEVLKERPWWAGIMVRDHHSARVRAMLETWASHVMRYSRRDQLSMNVAFRAVRLQPTALKIDNLVSELHSWPHTPGRDRERGARNIAVSLMPAVARARQFEQRLEEREKEVTHLREETERHEREVATLRGQAEQRERELAAQREETERHEREVATLRGQAEQRERELAAQREETERHEREVATLRGQAEQRERELAAQREETERHERELATLRGQAEQRERELAAQREETERHEREVATLRGQAEQRERELAAQREETERHERELATLRGQAEQRERELAAQRDNAGSTSWRITELLRWGAQKVRVLTSRLVSKLTGTANQIVGARDIDWSARLGSSQDDLTTLCRAHPEPALTVALLYMIVLGRPSDPTGMLNYLKAAMSGRPLKRIARDLLSSEEYKALRLGEDWWRRACRNAGEQEQAPRPFQSPASFCYGLARRPSVRRRNKAKVTAEDVEPISATRWSVLSERWRKRLAQSGSKKLEPLDDRISSDLFAPVPPVSLFGEAPQHIVEENGFAFHVETDVKPGHAAGLILVVCTHAPTIPHAGGLRILDMLHTIRKKHARVYLELFTTANPALYGVLGEASQIVDRIVVADNYNFALSEYLAKTTTSNYFDVVDFQFPQRPEVVESYRKIGRRLIFTPMESHIRNELIERKVGTLSEVELSSHKAIEEAQICRLVDLTVCVSEKDRAAIVECAPGNVTAIETGISHIEFSDLPAPAAVSDPIVIFVAYFGSLTNRKALQWYLKEVHPKILAAVPEYELQIVGRGDISDIFTEERLGVRYIGEVERLAPHICAAAVGIAPALNGSGFRGKVNQYARLGVPCVATALAADGLAYTHGTSIMVADGPDDFADCVVTLLTDGETRQRMGAAAAEICSAVYGWEAKWPAIAAAFDLPVHPDIISLPSVHAVVPSYHHADYIEQRLRSIFDQDYPKIRVTVVDDCSEDGSHEVIQSLRQEFVFDYVRNERNSGSPFSAWQYAAANTAEDLIWICESDDFCDRMMIGRLVREITARTRTGIAYCASWIVDERGARLGSTDTYFAETFHQDRWRRGFIARGDFELKTYQRFGMVVPNMSSALVDAGVFRKAFTPDLLKYRLAGDWLFVGRALQFADISYVPDKLNSFRRHSATSRVNTNAARRMAEHILARLSLSALAGCSELETLAVIRYDVAELRRDRAFADKVMEVMKHLDTASEERFAALLRVHAARENPASSRHGGLSSGIGNRDA